MRVLMRLHRCANVPFLRPQRLQREADKKAGLTARDKRLTAHPAAKYDKAKEETAA
jgi:hypothetical protein